MINPQWEQMFVSYFTTINKYDNDIDNIRIKLAKVDNFEMEMLFKRLDIDAKMFLSLNDFKCFLNEKGVRDYEEGGLRRFIHSYDKDNDFAISYSEFVEIILPQKDLKLKEEMIQHHNKCECDMNEVEDLFLEIIIKELDMIKELVTIANEVKMTEGFITYEAFLAIVRGEKYITKENLGFFLKENNFEYENEEVNRIVFRLDGDGDGKVSYEEFLEVFFPYVNIIKKVYEVRREEDEGNNEKENKTKYEEKVQESEIDLVLTNSKSIYNYKEKIKNYENDFDDNDNCNDKINEKSESYYNEYENKTKSYGTPMKINELTTNTNNKNNKNGYTLKSNYTEKSKNLPTTETPKQLTHSHHLFHSCYFEQTTPNSPVRTNVLIKPHIQSSINPSSNSTSLQKQSSLFNLLNNFIEQDNCTESLKESLALSRDVNLQNLFNFFDYSNSNLITQFDFCESLKELKQNFTLNDIKYIYKRYDKDGDGCFDYEEFCDMILPRKYATAKIMNERFCEKSFECYSNETKEYLIKLVKGMITSEKSNEKYRKALAEVFNYSTLDSFNIIKKEGNRGIYREDLEEFLKQNGKSLNLFERELLFLRFDKDEDGVICYGEYLREVGMRV